MIILQTFARGQPIRLNRLGHHEFASASASKPSFGSSSSRVDARRTCLRALRRPRRPSCHRATQRSSINSPCPIDAIGRILGSRRHHQLDPRVPNPHSLVAFPGVRAAFRGFLPRGLSDTCPQAAAMFEAAPREGRYRTTVNLTSRRWRMRGRLFWPGYRLLLTIRALPH